MLHKRSENFVTKSSHLIKINVHYVYTYLIPMQLSPFAGDQECWKKHYGDNWNIIQSFINRHVYSLQYCFHTCTFTTRFLGLVSRPEAKQRNKAIAIFHPRHFHCFVERSQRYERPKKSDWQQHDAFKPQRRLVIIIIIIIQLLDCFKFRVPQFRPKQYEYEYRTKV